MRASQAGTASNYLKQPRLIAAAQDPAPGVQISVSRSACHGRGQDKGLVQAAGGQLPRLAPRASRVAPPVPTSCR